MQNEKTQYIIDILKHYAKEQGVIVRSTSDLSPLEIYLLEELYKKSKGEQNTKESHKALLSELEIIVLNNEDDFDRGKGKYIITEWIEEKIW